MSGLTKEEVTKIHDDLEKQHPEATAFSNLDITDLDIDQVLYDDSEDEG